MTQDNCEKQRKFIAEILKKKQLEKGEIWYLLDNKWFKQWKKYTGYDSWDVTSVGDSSADPGPMDNAPLLLDNGKLKENLIDELDYMLVPQEAWDKLMDWYGLMEGQQSLGCKVIEQGMFVKHRKVEVYLMELKLCMYNNMETSKVELFSRADTVGDIEKRMRQVYEIPEDKDCRLWNKYMSNTFESLTKMDISIQDAGLYQGQVIVIEVKNEDGTWPRQPSSKSTKNTVSSTSSYSKGSNANGSMVGSSTSSAYNSNRYESHQTHMPGLCGLGNLGNTCFMNSALQVMSNVPQMTSYFLSDKWGLELNRENPLGTHGETATAYAELVQTVWSGKHTYTVPRNFKMAVGRFAPQFSGYQQHDSQELMAFLLDGLHEDLNRIRKKPYVEVKDADGRLDEIVAHEAWDNYKKRNDSIIVDIFHGLLKSTLVCPECRKISVTFDPFCYLSLPLPIKKERVMEVFYVSLEPSTRTKQYRVSVPKEGRISDLCESLSQYVQVPPSKLVVTDVYNHKFHKIFGKDENLTSISERDDIFLYESTVDSLDDPNYCMLPVYFKSKKPESGSSNSQLFGSPLLIPIPRSNCSYEVLYSTVIKHMKRFVSVPENPANWYSEEGGSEDKKRHNYNNHLDSTGDEKVPHCPPMFTFHFVNSAGSTDMTTVDTKSKPFTLTNNHYLSLLWHPQAKSMFYKEEEAEALEKDNTMFQKVTKKSHQLIECINLFTKQEQLGEEDPWYCPQCKQHQQASKKFDLWQLPPVMVIHLKRFTYNRYWRDKIDSLVDFPISGLDMSPWVINKSHPGSLMYDLIGVVNHFGGLGGGHYTAYAKNKDSSQWHCFDDSNVSAVSSDESVVTKAAYVLVYKRRDLSSGTYHNANGVMNGRDEAMDTS